MYVPSLSGEKTPNNNSQSFLIIIFVFFFHEFLAYWRELCLFGHGMPWFVHNVIVDACIFIWGWFFSRSLLCVTSLKLIFLSSFSFSNAATRMCNAHCASPSWKSNICKYWIYDVSYCIHEKHSLVALFQLVCIERKTNYHTIRS